MEKLTSIFGEELLSAIMNATDLYKKSKMIIDYLFIGLKDKSGHPSIEHLYTVGNSFSGEVSIVGLMHDILEDTIIDEEDLKTLGYSNDIINSIKILTRKENELYDDFIDRIINSKDKVAIEVKYRDMSNNMSEERLSKLDEQERERLLDKYNKNYEKLENKLKEINI